MQDWLEYYVIANLPAGRDQRNVFSWKKSSLKIKTGIFPYPGAAITIFSSTIFGISEIKVVRFDAFLRMFSKSSNEEYTASLSVTHFFPSKKLIQ